MVLLPRVAILLASAAGTALCPPPAFLQLPVTRSGHTAIALAMVNGHALPFMIDSGAFYSVISPSAAAALRLDLQPAPRGMRMSGAGGSADVSVGTVSTFGIGGYTLPNIQFLVGGTDVGAAGVIGQNILGLGDVDYDLSGGMVRLLRAGDCDQAGLAGWAAGGHVSVIAIKPLGKRNRHTIGEVSVNGERLRVMFDTGAATSVLTLAAAARLGLRPGGAGVSDAGMSTGFGPNPVRNWIGSFRTIRIGDEQISGPRLRFADVGAAGADMLIGADFFWSHRVLVLNTRHKLYFAPRSGSGLAAFK